MSIGHQEEERQGTFYTEPRSQSSAVMTYLKHENTLYVNSTYVPEAFRGQGVALLLMQAMVDYAQANEFKVVSQCSYVDVMFKRQPQWQHLLA